MTKPEPTRYMRPTTEAEGILLDALLDLRRFTAPQHYQKINDALVNFDILRKEEA